jgi:hypothetical protein
MQRPSPVDDAEDLSMRPKDLDKYFASAMANCRTSHISMIEPYSIPRLIQQPPELENLVTVLTPRHIAAVESDVGGAKEGWYATNKTGQVCSGRFSNREECQAYIYQERADIDAYHQGAAHAH